MPLPTAWALVSLLSASQPRVYQHQVAIVGGGVSGLTVAATLRAHGLHNITVLEGRDRLGGRVHSVPLGEAAAEGAIGIELGANWVQGLGSVGERGGGGGNPLWM